MNVKVLQRADRWVGLPLCFALTLFRRLFTRSVSGPAHTPRSLLFIKLAEQGSTVLAYPALRRAVEMVGPDRVYFITFEDNRFILDALDVIPKENVITVSAGGLAAFLRSMVSAILHLRRLNLDAAVDMEFFSRGSAALTLLSGARARVGFHAFCSGGPYRGDLMTHRLVYNPHLHASQSFLTLVEAVAFNPAVLPAFNFLPPPAPLHPPQFKPAPGELAEVETLIRQHANGLPPLVLLNPNSSDLLPLRRWPAQRYVELARAVLAKYPQAFVAFTGAPNEAADSAELVRRVGSDRCVSLAGKTTLRQLLVLYTLARVLVTNDSGPAHFATLTPIHVIALFGPETPELFAARTPRTNVLWAGIACSPCVSAYSNRQSPCRDNQCMQAITVERVLAGVCLALDQAEAAPAIPAAH
jgi:ADP-heptose:LPS heptosyltransferase